MIIPTKTLIPRPRRDLLSRTRLVNRLHRYVERALALICAPAGYGKTSLLVDFSRDAPLPVCWLTLDETDQDVYTFVHYVIAAICRRFPGFGEQTRQALAAGFAGDHHNPNALAGFLVQDIVHHLPEFFVLVLGDPGALEITAELGAGELSQMTVGQVASIQLLDRPGQSWSGSVRQLPYPYGGGAGGQTQAGDETAARIALDDPNVALELGELATVRILLEQKEDVLWLPPAAIRSFQGRDFVVIQDGDPSSTASGQGLQRRVGVRLGLKSEERVEVLEGVEEGQVVLGQ